MSVSGTSRNRQVPAEGTARRAASQAVPRPKTAVLVADAITDAILEGGLEPGMMLPSEAQMMEQYDVGRGTLREALRLLEAEGLIRVRPGRFGGPTVQQPPPERLGRTLSLLLRASGTSFTAVLEARQVIEPSLARSATLRATEEERQQLTESVRELADLVGGDERRFLLVNRSFHTLIAEMARSDALAAFWQAISAVSDGQEAGVHYDARAQRATVRMHQQIVDAIVSGDAEQAEQRMKQHVLEIFQYLEARYPHLVEGQVRILRSDSSR